MKLNDKSKKQAKATNMFQSNRLKHWGKIFIWPTRNGIRIDDSHWSNMGWGEPTFGFLGKPIFLSHMISHNHDNIIAKSHNQISQGKNRKTNHRKETIKMENNTTKTWCVLVCSLTVDVVKSEFLSVEWPAYLYWLLFDNVYVMHPQSF